MVRRKLGSTGLEVSPIGFGAFKIGRNEAIKYAQGYELPDLPAVQRLLDGVLDLGVNLIDTAPAYGLSEERIGATIAGRRREYVLSTKVGEEFAAGISRYDFSRAAVDASLERSLRRLRTDAVDIVLVHANREDLRILDETDVVETLQRAKQRGLTRFIGWSGKTIEAERRALDWADVVMVELHREDSSHVEIIRDAAARNVGVLVKKGLSSGRLPAHEAIRYVLTTDGVGSLVIGGLDLGHLAQNVASAAQ